MARVDKSSLPAGSLRGRNLPAMRIPIVVSVAVVAVFAFYGCGKKSDGNRQVRIGEDFSLAYAVVDSLAPGGNDTLGGNGSGAGGKASAHAYDGFYVNRKYHDGLMANLSIFATPFPSGSVSLQVHGDSVVMDYNNHEGGSGILLIDSGSWQPKGAHHEQMGSGPIVFRMLTDSTAQAWESGSDSSAEFLKSPPSVRNIEDFYASLFWNGSYRCVGEGVCRDTVVISGDTVTGLLRDRNRMRVMMDWMDNMPQMDYVVFSGPDSSRFAYAVSKTGLELFEIALPEKCKSINDYDCPLTESKRGRKVLELIRLAPVPSHASPSGSPSDSQSASRKHG